MAKFIVGFGFFGGGFLREFSNTHKVNSKIKLFGCIIRFLQLSIFKKLSGLKGLSWQPSGYDPVLPTQGARVQSLVRELRSHVAHGVAKKKQKEKNLREEGFGDQADAGISAGTTN